MVKNALKNVGSVGNDMILNQINQQFQGILTIIGIRLLILFYFRKGVII